MKTIKIRPEEYFTGPELAWLENLSNYWYQDCEDVEYVPFTSDDELAKVCMRLAEEVVDSTVGWPVNFWHYDQKQTARFGNDSTYRRAALMYLQYAAACGSQEHACELARLYRDGIMVERNVPRAQALFAEAARLGDADAYVGMGGLYEESAANEQDLRRAYECYVKASLVNPRGEAMVRLADFYAEGIVADRDQAYAACLYRKALRLLPSGPQRAEACLGLAALVSDPLLRDQGIEHDPIEALRLYQEAELVVRACGKRADKGLLLQAMEGQASMRIVLEATGWTKEQDEDDDMFIPL